MVITLAYYDMTIITTVKESTQAPGSFFIVVFSILQVPGFEPLIIGLRVERSTTALPGHKPKLVIHKTTYDFLNG